VRAVLIIIATSEAFSATNLSEFESQWKWLCVSILALGAAVDFLIAVILCYYLKALQKYNDNLRSALGVS